MVFLKSIKKAMLLISLTYIVVGLGLIIYKEEGVNNIFVFAAIGLALTGILSMIRYFLLDVRERIKREDFIVGALLISIGIILYMSRIQIKYLTFTIFGIAMCISAMIKIQDMLDLSTLGVKRKAIYAILFVVCFGIGVLVMLSPFALVTVNYIVTGCGLVLCGITDLISNFSLAIALSKYEKKLQEEKEQKKEETSDFEFPQDQEEIPLQ